MARPYSMDLRDRVVAAVQAGELSRHEAAARFGVSVSSAIRWVDKFCRTGSTAPDQMGGHKPALAAPALPMPDFRNLMRWHGGRHGGDEEGNPSFFVALGELRAAFGTHIAALAYQYGLDVEPELASILPSPDEE